MNDKGPSSPRQWIDAFDRCVTLRGLGWKEENLRRKNFHRLPSRPGLPVSRGVKAEMKCPAGVFLSFSTDSPSIAVRIRLRSSVHMNHMTAVGAGGAELFFRDGISWQSAAVAKPSLRGTSYEQFLVQRLLPNLREYRLYLPLYKEVEQVQLGIELPSQIQPGPEPSCRPVVFYGTSITQGGCANTAGSDFVSHLGRILDLDMINLGFSGAGKGEPEIATLLGELKPEMFVLDFLANAPNETLDHVLPAFIDILRERHPTTSVVLVGSPLFDQVQWDPEIQKLLEGRRDIAMRTYLERKEKGDQAFHFVDGNGLLAPGVAGTYVDGSHPTSHGFAIMAERLAPQLRVIRLLAKSLRLPPPQERQADSQKPSESRTPRRPRPA